MQTLPAHADRLISTLAQRNERMHEGASGPYMQPGPGSADARVDLKLLAHRARRSLEERGTQAARERLAGLESPDLWAGTVQDGTARGFKVALEEAISLCGREEQQALEPDPEQDILTDPKQLRRKREILVASAGTRLRFSRKKGVQLIDRRLDFNQENCIQFEDRRDCGDLDQFVPEEGKRPRIFLPGFLTPARLIQNKLHDLLEIRGRLGRRFDGYPCAIVFEGRKDEDFLRMTLRVENRQLDHRLRIRFLGVRDQAMIGHAGTPGWEKIEYQGRAFMAATLVRSCGRFRAADEVIQVPEAQCLGWIEHRFKLFL
ncbi:MAG: hypothetical protein ACYTG5_00130 [Planctomycetota bacterium]|jgi:hypothetical protein